MKRDKRYIKSLIEKYFEGASSNEEEKELYQYFGEKEIDESLEKYRALFHFLENDMIQELNELKVPHFELPAEKSKSKVYLLLTGTAVAASIILLFLFNPFKKEFNPYEGSYIVVDGVRKYDLERDFIEKRENEILEQIEQKEKRANEFYLSLAEHEAQYAQIENRHKNTENEYRELINNITNKNKEYEKFIQSFD